MITIENIKSDLVRLSITYIETKFKAQIEEINNKLKQAALKGQFSLQVEMPVEVCVYYKLSGYMIYSGSHDGEVTIRWI